MSTDPISTMNLLSFLPSKRSCAIVAVFVFCYAVTASVFEIVALPYPTEYRVFASLMYLPHGVAILAIMLFGWRALPALLAGNLLGDLLFKPAVFVDENAFMLIGPMCIAVLSAYLAFELFRHLGKNLYARAGEIIDWKYIVAVGSAAAIINAVSQKIVFDKILAVGHDKLVYWIYAFGNIWGLLVLLAGWMMIFRWTRRFGRMA